MRKLTIRGDRLVFLLDLLAYLPKMHNSDELVAELKLNPCGFSRAKCELLLEGLFGKFGRPDLSALYSEKLRVIHEFLQSNIEVIAGASLNVSPLLEYCLDLRGSEDRLRSSFLRFLRPVASGEITEEMLKEPAESAAAT